MFFNVKNAVAFRRQRTWPALPHESTTCTPGSLSTVSSSREDKDATGREAVFCEEDIGPEVKCSSWLVSSGPTRDTSSALGRGLQIVEMELGMGLRAISSLKMPLVFFCTKVFRECWRL